MAMVSGENKTAGWWGAGVTVIAGVILLIAARVFCRTPEQDKTGNEEQTDIQIQRLIDASASRSDREAARKGILEEHRALCRKLIVLIQPGQRDKLSEEARALVAITLGELRCDEAVGVLVSGLSAGPAVEPPVMSGAVYFASSCRDALIQIGRPSVPALLDVLQKSDNRKAVVYSLDALREILGGKRHMLETLEKVRDRVSDARSKSNLDAAFKIAAQLGESEEPLY
jgi:hypothetical protein